MTSMLRRLWADDRGSVISTELVLVIAILIFGIIPGLVALRNSVIAALGTIGNTLTELVPSFTFSGFAIGRSTGGHTIAQIQGYELDTASNQVLTGIQTTPIPLGPVAVIPPAP